MQTNLGETDDCKSVCAICVYLTPLMKEADAYTGKVPWLCERSGKTVKGDMLAKRYCRHFVDDRNLTVEESKRIHATGGKA